VSQVERPKNDVLVLQISRHHSLDLVRLPKARRYRVVFAERWGVQRRAFVEISFDDALTVAKFLANIDDKMRGTDFDDPPTDPGRPLTLPPIAVQQIVENGETREAVPRAVPVESETTGNTRPIAVDLMDDPDEPE